MGSKPGSARRDETFGNVTHVFLDVGGTLAYSEPAPADIFHRALAARGHLMDRAAIARVLRTPETIVTLIRPFPAGRENEFFREMNARIVEHLGLESDDAMLDEIHAEFDRGVAWRLYPESIDTLKALRGAGFHLGIISNASHTLPEMLRQVGLSEYFDTITYSFDVGAEKPDVRIFRRAVAQASVPEERCLHAGDSFQADYLGARRAGLHAVLVCREGEPPAPCPQVRSLESLADLLGVRRSPP